MKKSDFNMVIILGAARSGTHMLSRLLSAPDNVVYIGEPKYLWKYKNTHHGHDMLTPRHLTDEIRQKIRSQFHSYLSEGGGEILLEKTPSNSLRFEFVYNIFPEAKYVHIIRDGRDVARSARKRWLGEQSQSEKRYSHPNSTIQGATRGKIRQKVNRNEFRFIDVVKSLNYVLPLFLNNIGLKRKSVWGPRFPGIRQAFKKMELIEVCALQWKHCVESILNFSQSDRFHGHYFEICYEEIVKGESERIEQMFDFAGIQYDENARSEADYIKNRFSPPRKELNEEELHLINRHCKLLLDYLDYK